MNSEDIKTTIEISEIYDGVSVWVLHDGTFVNRWDDFVEKHPNDKGLRTKQERTQAWIDAHGAALLESLEKDEKEAQK